MADAATEFLVITGQTASGKEPAALAVAEQLRGEILSLDSMKVYRCMDIGTAKPGPEDRRRVPHHLLDLVDPWESFSTARWLEAADEALADVTARGRLPIVSGGTMLYLKALLFGLFEGPSADAAIRARLRDEAAEVGTQALHHRLATIDPQAAARIHANDLRRIVRALEVHELTGRPISQLQSQFGRVRPGLRPLVVALRRTVDDLRRRIDERVDRMITTGLEDEVRGLIALPQGLSREASQAVGYREMINHLEGGLSRNEAIDDIRKNTRTFARRQMTHLRSLDGRIWVDVAPHEAPDEMAQRIVNLWRTRTEP